jgi:hypothetical protein
MASARSPAQSATPLISTSPLVNACIQAAREVGEADEVTIETADIPLDSGGVINYCAQVAHMRVNTETGEVHVDDLVSAHDVAEIVESRVAPGADRRRRGDGTRLRAARRSRAGRGTSHRQTCGRIQARVHPGYAALYVVLLPGGIGTEPLNTKAIGEMGNLAVAPRGCQGRFRCAWRQYGFAAADSGKTNHRSLLRR